MPVSVKGVELPGKGNLSVLISHLHLKGKTKTKVSFLCVLCTKKAGLSLPGLYGDLVYIFIKLYACTDFSTQFR